MTDFYAQPENRVGASFLNVTIPGRNALTSGITGDVPATVYGTDPASYAREALFPGEGVVDKLKGAGKAVAGSLLALIIIALGIWVIIKQ